MSRYQYRDPQAPAETQLPFLRLLKQYYDKNKQCSLLELRRFRYPYRLASRLEEKGLVACQIIDGLKHVRITELGLAYVK